MYYAGFSMCYLKKSMYYMKKTVCDAGRRM